MSGGDDWQVAVTEWRSIGGYEGLYSVSSAGSIRNDRTGRMLAPRGYCGRYASVKLCRDGIGKRFGVHQLVCRAFHGPGFVGAQAAHLDGNKLNNTARNLAWATPAENESHKTAHGTKPVGERNGLSKLSLTQVQEIRSGGQAATLLAKAFGVTATTIREVRRGKTWRHVLASELRELDEPVKQPAA